MTSTNNLHEPISAGRTGGIEAASQTHLQTPELTHLPSPIDHHSWRLTEPPSIDTAVQAESPLQINLLSPADQYPSDATRIFANGQEDASSRNLDFQSIWEESMEGVGSTGTPHKKAAVLMVSWAKELDELDTGPEVKDLADTFRDHFRYDVVEVELNAEKLPQFQLMKHLAIFMGDFDSEGTLLIIYYAGHGLPGQPGELYFASKKTNKQRSEKNSIPWHQIEPMLQPARGDILLIFDCCYAGNLDPHIGGRGHWATRSFELLAACKHNAITHPPGPKSFTKALIWALIGLLKERGKFSTHELQMKIQHAKGFPEDQQVRIIDRGDPSDHRLVLAPVPLPSDSTKSETVSSPRRTAIRPKKFIDLRFWYNDIPDEDEIKELSTRVKQLIHNEHIKAYRVGWIRLGNVDQVRNVLEHWRRRTTTTLPQLTIPHSPHAGHLQPSPSPPPSHSGHSSMCDAHLQHSKILPTSIKVLETTSNLGDGKGLPKMNVDGPGICPSETVFVGVGMEPKSLTGVLFFSKDLSITVTMLGLLALATSCFMMRSSLINYFTYGK